jgi:hypothetical protein
MMASTADDMSLCVDDQCLVYNLDSCYSHVMLAVELRRP